MPEATSYFADDAALDDRVSKEIPDAGRKKERKFANLDPVLSMFLLMPRAEKPESCYLPAYVHNQLRAPRDENSGSEDKERFTSRICLRALGEGPCAICDVRDTLKSSKVPGEVKLYEALTPRKKVYAAVWWIPLQLCTGKPTTKYTWKGSTFSGKPATFELRTDEGLPIQPSLKVLGFPEGVWANLKSLLERRGVEKFIGRDGIPLSIQGNGVALKGRRYKEPREEFDFPYKDLLPPENIELLNLREAVDVPEALEVARLAEFNWPGRLSDLSVYAAKEA